MNKNVTENLCWYLITIDDAPKFLPGESIHNLLKLIQYEEKIEFGIIDAIEGSGKYGLINSLQNNKGKVFEIVDLLKICSAIDHLEWGDFFLFKEYPACWKNPKGEQYPYVISQANVTVRAVDDQYLYIYIRKERELLM
jgi:hypothetical protein